MEGDVAMVGVTDAMVRRVRADEWPMLRATRLAALADTPSAFGATHAHESLFDDHEWRERARLGSTGDARASFLAWRGERAVGLVGGLRSAEHPDLVDLVSMWCIPDIRRSGVAGALIDAVLTWARSSGTRAVGLWVTRGNEAAIRLYERFGFVANGDHQALPSDPCTDELRMELVLH